MNIVDLTLFMEQNTKGSKNKKNLLDFMRDRICKYSKANINSHRIAGMNMLLDDVRRLSEREFMEDERNKT